MKAKLFFVLFVIVAICGCSSQPKDTSSTTGTTQQDQQKRIKIGFAMDTLKEERWQRDHDAFKAHCEKMNAECIITIADNKADKQANDVDNLLTQKVDVLVIAPHDATQAASMVDKAKAQNVPVISYDRLINSDKIDAYISHQVPVIGQKMAEYALQNVPKGKYVMVYGSSADNNAHIMKKAQLAVLQPGLDRKDITVVADNFMPDWRPDEALKKAENA